MNPNEQHRMAWADRHVTSEPTPLQKEDSLPPSIHDSALNESKQSNL